MTSNITEFLNGTGIDHQVRFITDIWKFSDRDIEYKHDFIQWVFPLTEPKIIIL